MLEIDGAVTGFKAGRVGNWWGGDKGSRQGVLGIDGAVTGLRQGVLEIGGAVTRVEAGFL